jgi:hypothetical protein
MTSAARHGGRPHHGHEEIMNFFEVVGRHCVPCNLEAVLSVFAIHVGAMHGLLS